MTAITTNFQSLIPIEFFKNLPPFEYTLESFFKVDFSKWDWSQLIPSQDFKWEEGVTPFSNKNFVFMSAIAYVVLVYLIKFSLSGKDVKGFSFNKFPIVHNLILSVWSLIMCVGAIFDIFLLATQTEYGISALFCSPKSNPITGRIYYWHYLYFISKFYEFIDTFIIVLRKKPLIFLHIWHHFIVVIIVWTWFGEGIAYGTVGLLANTLVHVFMYYYYFRTALNPNIRIWWKSYLTSGQIFQFSISFVLAIPFVVQDLFVDPNTGIIGHNCTGYSSFIFTMINNLIFLILFVNFYQGAYRGSRVKTD
ncbi:GNS1/SUR4 family protein [Tieghemostelium lacteum]|uniref:Elongation of fatty acids protein n=1 Tax=Tieghemostelium lacteum TaxID=361077 RepID=A0A152A8V9_TIELA|nr:GNS1/SUR4 family protein [Tieghemostelium lacteum]|eukprot:KYR02659.1 GNS1/SUR4 family protein [Tieghemostelium lacteum]